jgi:hypothetical protein
MIGQYFELTDFLFPSGANPQCHKLDMPLEEIILVETTVLTGSPDKPLNAIERRYAQCGKLAARM